MKKTNIKILLGGIFMVIGVYLALFFFYLPQSQLMMGITGTYGQMMFFIIGIILIIYGVHIWRKALRF